MVAPSANKTLAGRRCGPNEDSEWFGLRTGIVWCWAQTIFFASVNESARKRICFCVPFNHNDVVP